ncbi:MAG TPA: DUF6688 family protein [Verrucomicrobiae bacterium]|jgi:hypothetical protein
MSDLLFILCFVIGISSVLALPALKRKSWCQFFIAVISSFLVVLLPLFVFFLSSLMGPDWKGDCTYGWLNCFIVGKLALTPLVLLATAALYSLEILRVENRAARWIVVGIFLGAIVSSVCFGFGLVCIGFEAHAPLKGWLLVPFYIAIWYSIRAIQLIKATYLDFKARLISLALSLPFWLVSWWWSRSLFASLPDQQPSCFIVTAAGRGHAIFVGRHIEIEHNGRNVLVNQQLITFWQFENRWQNFSPRSHQVFRCGYNRIGPVIAARIKSPWFADFVYLTLKPFELVAEIINKLVISKLSSKDCLKQK